MKNYIKILLICSIFVTTYSSAVTYKNPVTNTKSSQNYLGIAYTQISRDLTSEGLGTGEVDETLFAASYIFGLVDSSVEIRLGLDDITSTQGDAGSSSGIQYGIVYRKNMSLIEGENLKSGFFASFQGASVSDGDTDSDYYVYEIGAGVSKRLDAGMNLYGGTVLSILQGSIYGYYTYDFEGVDTVGFFAGIDKTLSNDVKVGVELNMIHQTGFSLFAEFPF